MLIPLPMKPLNKYTLYEKSVQNPKPHIDWLVSEYRRLRGKYARHLREDFCGTFKTAALWVARNRANTAVGLDLDPEPLTYGHKNHLKDLNREQRKRLSILRQNVLSVTNPRADLIVAGNFSFYIFKQRQLLLEYFINARKSVKSDGFLVLEMAGGPGMIESIRERKAVYDKGKRVATYIWDQKSFDPITHDAQYAIHFRLADGRVMRDAFTYDWRLWTIPEVRELLAEAGFAESFVYWETEHNGEGTGEYVRMENGDNAFAWIAYVFATLKPTTAPSKQDRR